MKTPNQSKSLWTLVTTYLFARLDASFRAERAQRNSRLAWRMN